MSTLKEILTCKVREYESKRGIVGDFMEQAFIYIKREAELSASRGQRSIVMPITFTGSTGGNWIHMPEVKERLIEKLVSEGLNVYTTGYDLERLRIEW